MSDLDTPFDIAIPAPSRRYNAWQGGKDNFAVDRASANTIERAFPTIKAAIAENRRCLLRAVRFLAAECGIRQFLDIGCGLPDPPPLVHEIAQEIAPASRVLYVDNDPMVAAHTLALTRSTPEGRVGFHPGDLRKPSQILSADLVRGILDFSQPIAVLLFAVAHFLPDEGTVHTAVHELTAGLPAGSYLAFSHATLDPLDDDQHAVLEQFTKPEHADGPFKFRSHDEITALLASLDLVEPGLVSTMRWRPGLVPQADPILGEHEAICYAAVARKP